jgi:hypothetical protein
MFGFAVVVVYRGTGYYLGGAARHHVETAWFWFVAATVLFVLGGGDRRGPTAAPPAILPRPSPVPIVLAVLLALMLYWPATRVGFLSDDFVLAARAARNDFFQGWTDLFRPIPLTLFRLAGPNPILLHTINIVLHGLNAALVRRVARRLTTSAAATIAGLLFLTFPASVEAVAWCSGVQDVLMTTLTLLTLEAASADSAWAFAPLSAALLTKETAVAAPVLLGATQPRRRRLVVITAVVVLGYLAVRIAYRALPDTYAVRPSAYTIKELVSRAFATLAVPLHSSLIQAHPWMGAAIVVGMVLLVLRAAIQGRRRSADVKSVAVMVVWILVAVAPVYSYFFVTEDLAGSRYLYLSAIGWCTLVSMLLVGEHASAGVASAAAVLLLVNAAGTQANLRPWLAATRDRVIAAVRQAKLAGCHSVWVGSPPDSAAGAYVFRNGLAEAIHPVPLDPDAPAGCRFDGPF